MIEELGAILWSKWEANLNDKCQIVGKWSEDSNYYCIVVPPQLRDQIITVQNWLHKKYIKLENMKKEIQKLERFFEDKNEN